MSTISDEKVLASLLDRLRELRPDSARRWGTLTPGAMLCHLGDAHESVLGTRPPPGPPPGERTRALMKWLVLYSFLPWPKGVPTRPGVDPAVGGTRPGDFASDRERVLTTLSALARAAPSDLAPRHFMLGPMSARDWRRWAYRHVDHHLRQFGL